MSCPHKAFHADRCPPEYVIRDAVGLGGPGVEATPSFNSFTLDAARDALKALRENGYEVVTSERLAGALRHLAGQPDSFDARLDSGDYGLLERPSEFGVSIMGALNDA